MFSYLVNNSRNIILWCVFAIKSFRSYTFSKPQYKEKTHPNLIKYVNGLISHKEIFRKLSLNEIKYMYYIISTNEITIEALEYSYTDNDVLTCFENQHNKINALLENSNITSGEHFRIRNHLVDMNIIKIQNIDLEYELHIEKVEVPFFTRDGILLISAILPNSPFFEYPLQKNELTRN